MRKFILPALVVVAVAGFFFIRRSHKPTARQLVSSVDDQRNLAFRGIDRLKDEDRARLMDEIIPYTANPDEQTRRLALYALRRLHVQGPKLAKAAADRLTDPSERVRDEAGIALIEAGPEGIAEAARRLTSGKDRAEAASVLANAGEAGAAALSAALKNEDESVRLTAALALHRKGLHPPEAFAPLLESLNTPTWGPTQLEAVSAIAVYGSSAAPAVPRLADAVRKGRDGFDGNAHPAPAAADAITEIEQRRWTMDTLTWDLKNKDALVRYTAAYHVTQLSSPPAEAMEPLIGALGDSHAATAARALVAITRIGVEKTERVQRRAYPGFVSALRKGRLANFPGFITAVRPTLEPFARRLSASDDAWARERGKEMLVELR